MKLSRHWCAEFIGGGVPTGEALASRLTAFGFEVDAVSPTALVEGEIIAGKILSHAKHPNADSLQVCLVDIGTGVPQTIVCGAPNVCAGMGVAVAQPGVRLAGVTIKNRAIRGVESAGMLCSAAELGIGREADGILELSAADGDITPGSSLSNTFRLNDEVLEVGITPNRSDCLSHLGLAREIAAIYETTVNQPTALDNADMDETFSIKLEAPEACPYYGCLLMRNVDCSLPSPWGLKTSIERCGGRSVNAVVDITNYLMLAFGQPLHVFDADKLTGGICVRYAKRGEQLRLLDGSLVECAADDVLIADDAGGVALGGVMGGLETGATEQTRNILLEAAFFPSAAIRGKTRKFNIYSDAAFRFERGVDPNLSSVALTHAAALIKKIGGGQVGKVASAGVAPQQESPVSVSFAKVGKLLGLQMDITDAATSLKQFHLPTAIKTPDTLSVEVPSWRFDIKKEVDVIEEVARAWGYDRLPETMPAGGRVFKSLSQSLPDKARTYFAAQGFFEVITYSFVPSQWEQALSGASALPLQNPMSEEMALMRTTLWSGLLDRAVFNVRHKQARVCLFEVGRCFFSARGATLPNQPTMLAGVAYGRANPLNWAADNRQMDFYDVKGVLESFFPDTTNRHNLRFVACQAESPALHPGKAADIFWSDVHIGRLGELHPAQVLAAEFKTPPIVFEINLDSAAITQAIPAITPVSHFPVVSRDLAVMVDKSLPVGALIACARRAAPTPPVTDVQLFDFYPVEGDNTPANSCGLRLSMQGGKVNLTSDDIEKAVTQVLTAIQQECHAILRD